MPQTGMRERVVATSGTYFVGTLAQNAQLTARIPLPESIGAGRHARCMIEGIQIVSADLLDWDIWFFATQNGLNSGDPANEAFLGRWGFTVASGDGVQIAGAGLGHYYIDGLGIFYLDEDGHNAPSAEFGGRAYLNVALVNRSVAAKSAAGFFKLTLTLQPTLD